MSLLQDFVSLFFPNLCPACDNVLENYEEHICTICQFKMPETNFYTMNQNPLEQLFWGRVDIQAATAHYYYSSAGRVRNLIHQLKYNEQKELGIYLGKELGNDLLKTTWNAQLDAIIPVPLHPSRLKSRGYNQSEVIAQGISQTLNIPILTNNLIRREHKTSQTHRARYARWKNVSSIFEVKNTSEIKDKHLLLVDDIITTGATIEACAEQLLKVPGIKVSIASVAFTPSISSIIYV